MRGIVAALFALATAGKSIVEENDERRVFTFPAADEMATIHALIDAETGKDDHVPIGTSAPENKKGAETEQPTPRCDSVSEFRQYCVLFRSAL